MGEKKKYKYLDLSGYAFTGKHAVIDLMREFSGFCVPHFQYEFNLIRIQGGIRDLETALVDDWSPIRSDAAIRRFLRLIGHLGSKNSYFRPKTWFTAAGWNYDDYFHGNFILLSNRYIAQLTQATWVADWPYPIAELCGYDLFLRKLKRLLGIKASFDFQVCLSAPDNFIELTRNYMNDLLAAFVGDAESDVHTVVMHNSFEPFNPYRALRYFHSAKAIIVDRDPRDNYVAGLWYRPTALPVREFIKRYRLYRKIAAKNEIDSRNVLKIRFESLVLDYERSVDNIFGFLDEDRSAHVTPKKYFDPAVSAKNIGTWRQYDKQEEIETIYRELKEFCYE